MKISITLPNYNHAKYLAQNIEAVLSQTYDQWELIIVDDGSTDESWSIIDRYTSDPRIRAVRLAENEGANAAMKRCLSLADGDLLYASSSDDYLASASFFGRAVEQLAKYPDAGGVCGRSRVIDAADGAELWVMGTPGGRFGFITGPQAIKRFFLGRLFIPGTGAIWRRARIEEIGGYDATLGPQSDYFVNHAIPALHGVVYLEDVVGVTRVLKGSYSSSVGDEEFFRFHSLLEKRIKSLPHRSRIRDEWIATWRYHVANGRLAISRQEQFFELVRRYCGRIEHWERSALPARFANCTKYLLDTCRELESELSTRRALAARIFVEVAGPLASDPPHFTPTPSAPRRSLLKALGKQIIQWLRDALDG